MAILGVRVRDRRLAVTDMRDLVKLAEHQRYDSVWLPESLGREVFTELTALVLAGERIRVGTGMQWEDEFKRLLLRFEPLQCRHYAMKLMAYRLINWRGFCRA